MALVVLSICLCIVFLDAAQGRKSAAFHSLCKLEMRIANCSERRLSSILQDLPPGTEELFLDANVIHIIKNGALGQYQALQFLSLCENGLEVIESGAFLGNRNLSSLSLANNGLSTNYQESAVALSTLSVLRQLDLSGNQLTEAMVAILIQNLSSLESLTLARNAIMRLDGSHLRNLPNLQHLDLQHNYIFEIETGSFEGLKGLQQLNLAYNYIPCIAEFDLTQLRMLNISNNNIEWFLTIEKDVSFELEILDLSHNQLLFYPLLPRQSKLRTLLLQHNQLNFYGNLFNNSNSSVQLLFLDGNITNTTTFGLWEESYSNLSSLYFLDMSWNQLQYLPDTFFEGLVSLSHLNLSHNCLGTLNIQERELLESLIDLDLGYNQLLDLQMNLSSGSSLANLRSFSLSTNRLRSLPEKFFSYATKITTVDLSKNPIELCASHGARNSSCVNVSNSDSIRNFYLAGCNLDVLDNHTFKGTSIVNLDLSDNPGVLLNGLEPLGEIAQTLQVLSLRNTALFATRTDFSAFQKLVSLDLSQNFLANFPESLMNLELYSLDLRRNCLSSIPQYVMQKELGKNLHVIYLSQNPYDCCNLNWWITLQHLSTVHIADSTQVTCNFSSSLISVINVPESIFQKCRWLTADMNLMCLVIILPICVVLLSAFVIIILSSRKKVLQMVKRRYRTSSPY